MKNYKEQNACLICLHSRLGAATHLYCNVEDDYPKVEGRYDSDFFEKARIYELQKAVKSNGVCDNFKREEDKK